MFPLSDYLQMFNIYFIAFLSFRAFKQGATRVYWIILIFIHRVIENAPHFDKKTTLPLGGHQKMFHIYCIAFLSLRAFKQGATHAYQCSFLIFTSE